MNIQEDNPWVKLPTNSWEKITKNITPARFERNAIIYHQGDILNYAFIVKSGRIRLSYYSVGGEEKGVYIAEQNCMFGEAVALPGYTTYYTATAIVDTELYLIPVSRLLEAINTDPDFALQIILLMSRKMRIYSVQGVELSFTETYARICHALTYIAETYGTRTEEGVKIKIKFTHQELANMIHASRVSVANVFSELTRKGIIHKDNGYYTIKKPEELIPEEP